MAKKIFKNFSMLMVASLLSLTVALGLSARQPVFADAKSDVCSGVGLVTGSTSSGCGNAADTNKKVNDTVGTVVNILSIIVGLIAVIMIIISGLRFVLSGGDAQHANSARSAIIYSVVGLVIVALAQVIVRYVLGRV